MRHVITTLSVLAAIGLSGCGEQRARVPSPSRAAFPTALPPGTALAYATRMTAPLASRRAVASTVQSLALTATRQAYVSCRSGTLARRVGSVPVGEAAGWKQLLGSAHLTRLRSDPPDSAHRAFWFVRGGRVVYLDLARLVGPSRCTGTECTAMLHYDPVLRALMPARTAFGAYIAAHCPAGG